MALGGRRLWIPVAIGVLSVGRPAAAQVGTDARDAARADDAVQPPKLVKFVPALYPPGARERGQEAEVVLALDIDALGKVTQASVVEAAGDGFDEVARAAALLFEFEPARRNGRPVRSRILYRYEFHLERPAQTENKLLGGIEGRVLDPDEKPAAGARVRLVARGKPLGERVADAAGRFEFPGLAPGDYQLTIERDGAAPFEVTETLAADERISATYRLERVPPAGEGIEILVEGTRPRREVTRRPIERRELSRIPGTSGDALRALQNLPGVARPPSLSGLLAVRGNGENTTPVFIDGLWLPTVYHFGGLSSVVPTEMIDEINFYPGNFSVRYGRALAGVVDAHLRETRDDGRYHGLLQLDLIDVRGMAEGPIPGTDDWNFIGGFRRSHVDAWLTPLVEGEETEIKAAPVYYDYQFLIDHRPSPKSYLRIGTLGADDRFRIIESGSATGGEIENIDSSVGLGVLYTHTFHDRLSLDLSATMARLHQVFELSTIEVETVAWGSIGRAELSWQMWDRAKLRVGYDLLLAPYTVRGQLPEDPGPTAPAVGSFVTTPTRKFDHSDVFLQPAVYAEFELAPSGRTEVVSGVRLDYTHETGRFDLSPRLTARYELVQGFPGTALKAGSGLFFQPPGLAETVLSEEESLRSMRSFQNSLGVEQELTDRIELSVEGFFNLLDDLISRDSDESGALAYNNRGTGRIFGAEFMLRYKADEDLFGWISYTLSRSERTWVPGEPSQLFYLDQTHILTALASYRLGRGWEIGGRFRYVTGNLYTPCQGGLFSSISTQYLCLNGRINSERLPAFHQLDLRVDKRWTFSGWSLGAYLDLINAYNRTNPDFIDYNFDYTESRPLTGSLPIVPSLGVRGEF